MKKILSLFFLIMSLYLAFALSASAASDDAYIINFPYDVFEGPTDGDPSAPPFIMTFGENGNGTLFDETVPMFGNAHPSDGALKIEWAEETNFYVNYMAKIKFTSAISETRPQFIRVLYCANNPVGVENASMLLLNDGTEGRVMIQEKLSDTAGHYVLSDTAVISYDHCYRFMNGIHNSLYINTNKPGGEYFIKAIYFFETREGAENYSYELDPDETAPIKEKETEPPVTVAPPEVTDKQTDTQEPSITDKETKPVETPSDTKGPSTTVIVIIGIVAAAVIAVVVVTIIVKKKKS